MSHQKKLEIKYKDASYSDEDKQKKLNSVFDLIFASLSNLEGGNKYEE